MSHEGREDREGMDEGDQRAKEKDRVRVMETGSEPVKRPQKSNYSSSRKGVCPAPRHSF